MTQMALDIAPVLPELQTVEPEITQYLPNSFKKNGHTYILLQRGQKAVCYQQGIDNITVGYEVFLIKVQAEHKLLNGKTVSAKEKLPSNESLGSWAWSFKDLNRALHKYNLLEREEVKDGQ
jgi:hypothetical protein